MKTAIHSRLYLQVATSLFLGLAVLLALPAAARAAPGDLDPTLSGNGKVVTILGQRPISALDTAIQADGKIVIVGYSWTPSNLLQQSFILARYNVDGSPDRDFGNGGSVTPNLGYGWAAGEAIAVEPDGKIIVAGWVGEPGSHDFLLARFNLNGSLDTTFGSGGTVTTDFLGAHDSGSALAIQADGQIVVAGTSSNPPGYNADFALALYHPDGSLDTSFGDGGRVIVDLGTAGDHAEDITMQTDGKLVIAGAAAEDLALARLLPSGSLDGSFADDGIVTGDFGFTGNALEIQADGKMIVVGTGRDYYQGSVFALGRFNSDGSVDRTFGNQGFVITDFAYDEFGSDVIVQTDGRIVAVGSTETVSDQDFALARYHPDGSLDDSFGTAGTLTTDFENRFDHVYAVSVQHNGKIVVVGNTAIEDGTFSSDIALARYSPDGSLDAEFGDAGRVTSNFELGQSVLDGVAVQVDGKIVAAGRAYRGSQSGWDFALTRTNPDGSLDPGFGRGGFVTTDIQRGDDYIAGLVIQLDGKIVVAGGAEIEGLERFALARYLPDGFPDPSFGNGGFVTTAFAGSSARGSAVALQPDGKMIVLGNSTGFAMARYHPDGTLDSTFGNDGTVTTSLGNDGLFDGASTDIVLQPDGKIAVAGMDKLNFAMARFNPNGSFDPAFGSGGIVITDFGGNDWCTSLAMQADGKLIAAGNTENGGHFALARYNPDGSLDPTFGAGGMVTVNVGGAMRGGDIAIQPGGKILMAGAILWPATGGGDLALVRYQPDGALDKSFGASGVVITDFAGGLDLGRAIALQRNGKIIVAGTTADTFALARYEGWNVLANYLPVITQAAARPAGGSR